MNPSPWKLAAGIYLLSPIFGWGEDLPHPSPVISFAMPDEVDAPVDPDENAIAVFDDYSWREFIAINWPAKRAFRGVPDVTRRIGDFSDPATKVVGARWKADYDRFQKQGAVPTEWSWLDGVGLGDDLPFQGSGNTKVLGSFSKFRDFNQVNDRHSGGPLIAQNNTYVRFEVRLNEAEFEFIRNQQLYLKSKLPEPGDRKLRFPNNCIAVKAAWKVIKDDELPAAESKYYLVDAMLLDPVTNKCKMQKMGLVGLHIVQKTQLRPQRVWSSFQHIDNVPEAGTTPPVGRRFSFND